MKAKIDDSGIVTLAPETPLERQMLHEWFMAVARQQVVEHKSTIQSATVVAPTSAQYITPTFTGTS